MTPKIYLFKKVVCLLLFTTLLFNSKQVSAQQFLTTIDGWNAYVHLPDDYNDSLSKKYPVIIFIPGLGEVGTDPSKLLIYGPSKFIAQGYSMNFLVNGKMEKPIVISIQPVNAWPNAYLVNKHIDSITARYRVDLQRISGTGLSMGGWAFDNYVDNYNTVYNNKLASIVALSALEPDNTITNMKYYALGGGKWWGFEGNTDLRKGDQIRDTLNYHVAGSARYTLYSGGHCCWNDFYIPTYMENGESIYTWMMKQKRPGITNSIPEANAGRDSIIPIPITSLTLRGTGNDPVGNPITFAWSKISGPSNGSITSPSSAQTNLSGLATGSYKFELKVTNILGGVGKDTIFINNGNFILPVKLMEFKAIEKAGSVSLLWKTSSEINSSHFMIEHSTNGISYTDIGRVAATTNPTGGNYEYKDAHPAQGVNYYRLRMVDLDASYAYSNVINVDLKSMDQKSISIATASYINSNLNINVYARNPKQVSFSLTDALGKILYHSNISLQKGPNYLNRMVISAKGIYYATIVDDKVRATRTIYNQ